ncbi:MAG: hypothetical protein KUG77_16105, partial [Nannocystaceae bacterium]|nr:hypothetical protein [Nannocystaceae bacterium]
MRGLIIGLGILAGGLLSTVLACDSDTAQSCMVGSLDCACTAGGGCDPGLSCAGDTCIFVDNGTSGQPPTAGTSATDPSAGVTTMPSTATSSTGSDSADTSGG